MDDYNFNLEDNINQGVNKKKSFNNLWQNANTKEKIEIILFVFLVVGSIFLFLLGLLDRGKNAGEEIYSPELQEQILNP
jgi:hypothetical protein